VSRDSKESVARVSFPGQVGGDKNLLACTGLRQKRIGATGDVAHQGTQKINFAARVAAR
jgi:hypothetical protein